MACCGPKCSICCLLISVWAIIMLSILGGLLYIKSIAFVEDVGVEELNPKNTIEESEKELTNNYEFAAYNCWIACGIYVVTFVVSLQQYYSNKRSQSL